MAGRSRVSGYRETASALLQLGNYVAVPLNEASRHALAPMVVEARANLDRFGVKRTGALKKALTVKRDSRSPRLRPVHVVGPDAKSPAVRYAHLVEFGTRPRVNLGMFAGTLHPGTPRTRFLTIAFETVRETVVKRFGERIGPAMEKRAAQIARKARR